MNFTRNAILGCLVCVLGTTATVEAAKKKELKGFITEISRENRIFSIVKYTINITPTTKYVIENNERLLNLTLDTLKLGDYVEVEGELEGTDFNLVANEIRIDAEQYEETIKRTAYLHKPIAGLTRSGNTWSGLMHVDGQRIQIIPDTRLIIEMNQIEKDLAKKEKRSVPDERPLTDLSEIAPGDLVEYSGMRGELGDVEATQLVFQHNTREKGEIDLFKQLQGRVKPPNTNLASPKHGQLQVSNAKYKLYYDAAVQEYVSQLGQYMVPEYMTKLPEGHPNKIHFHFFVIDGEDAPNAFAYPNGIIAINTAMLTMIENEAQLAFILGHEIAHVTNEHTYRQRQFHRKKRTILGIASIATGVMGYGTASSILQLTQSAITSGYQRFLEDQSDRVALMYCYERGYDPTQGVDTWQLMADTIGNSRTNFFWSDHNSHLTRMSYLLVLLRNNFPEMTNDDFSKMSQGKERFMQVTQNLRQDPRLGKIRKKLHNEKWEQHVIWHDTSLRAQQP